MIRTPILHLVPWLRRLTLRRLAVLLILPGSVWLVGPTVVHADAAKNQSESDLPQYVIDIFGTPPAVPEGPLSDAVAEAVDVAFGDVLSSGTWGPEQSAAIEMLSSSDDPRLAWLISDMMRLANSRDLISILGNAATQLLNITFEDANFWGHTTDHLIAWDIPAPPDYLKYKRNIYTIIEPVWEKLFIEGDIDWRHVSWGGVRIDDRAYNATEELCNCIPAADNPNVTTAEEAKWLKDDAIVFGIEINGEYRAYPRRIMEVREMINDTAAVTSGYLTAHCAALHKRISPMSYLKASNGQYCVLPVC